MVKTGMRRMKIHTGHVRQQRPRRRYGERNDGISVHGDPVERGAEQGCPERVPGGVRRAQADIQQKILRTHGPSVRIGRFGVQMVKDRAAIRGDGPAVRQPGDGPKSFRMQSHQGNPHIVNGGIVEKILAAGAESPQGAGNGVLIHSRTWPPFTARGSPISGSSMPVCHSRPEGIFSSGSTRIWSPSSSLLLRRSTERSRSARRHPSPSPRETVSSSLCCSPAASSRRSSLSTDLFQRSTNPSNTAGIPRSSTFPAASFQTADSRREK